MLKESDFKNYFEGKISIEILIEHIKSKEIAKSIPESRYSSPTPTSARFSCPEGFHDLKEDFVLRKDHLIKLCEDFLEEKLSAWDLEDIAFILEACDGIVWDDHKQGDRDLIAEIIFNWSAPEVYYPLTKDYIKEVREFLGKS